MVENAAKCSLQVRPDLLESTDVSSDCGCLKDSDSDTFSNPASDSDYEPLMSWDKWESFVKEMDASVEHNEKVLLIPSARNATDAVR